jgi:hypothetical protein
MVNGKTPENYIHWRIKQGFDLQQADFLYRSIESIPRREKEIETWLASNETERAALWSQTIETIIAAQKSICERHDDLAKKLIPRLHVTLPRIEHSTKLALTGHYYEALVLLRSAIEGFLRFTLDLVYEFRFHLSETLENLKDEQWKDARKVEHALAIGSMCTWLRKMKLAGNPPFTNKNHLYKYLDIDSLNYYTHSNVIPMIGKSDGEFDPERFEYYVDLHRKLIESIIIIWQNLSDKIERLDEPLVKINIDFSTDDMPLLAKLIETR